MSPTTWANKASSVPSDRIPPSRPSSSQAKGSGKQKEKEKEQPKSKEVRRLAQLRDALSGATLRSRDPKGGCFCQARVHPLSAYTPICRSCGLVLCELHMPHHACPHCGAPLLTPAARDALVATLETQIADTLAKEQAQRERALQEARDAAGAFPALSPAGAGAAGADPLRSHPANQTHKVLSLNSRTKRVTVSSYTSPAASSRPASRSGSASAKEKENEEGKQRMRVPPPPPEVVYAKAGSDPSRPWANLRGASVTYVPPTRSTTAPGAKGGSSRRKSKTKENQRQSERNEAR